jgi:hypothetical protein
VEVTGVEGVVADAGAMGVAVAAVGEAAETAAEAGTAATGSFPLLFQITGGCPRRCRAFMRSRRFARRFVSELSPQPIPRSHSDIETSRRSYRKGPFRSVL